MRHVMSIKKLKEAIASSITEQEDTVFPYVGIGNVLDQSGLNKAIVDGIRKALVDSPVFVDAEDRTVAGETYPEGAEGDTRVSDEDDDKQPFFEKMPGE